MSRALLARKPVANIRLDYSVTNVTTGAWVDVVAALAAAADAIELFNGSGSTLLISTGATGQENAGTLPYYILPGGSSILLPWNIKKGAKIAIKAVDATADTGSFIANLFG